MAASRSAWADVVIAGPEGAIDVMVEGEGPPVVMLPSLGRGAADFDDLAARLVHGGFTAVRPEPRGIGGTEGLRPDLTMRDLAGDVAAVIAAVDRGPAVVVGHAFGNRLARMTAVAHPELVTGVVCIAAGGLVAPPTDLSATLRSVFDLSRSPDEHTDDVRRAFFAPGNEPDETWRGGWFGLVAAAQGHATRSTPIEDWWLAGSARVLVLQGSHDVFAPPENGERLAAEAPERVTLVTIAGAGHALLPEQPVAIAAAILDWLPTP